MKIIEAFSVPFFMFLILLAPIASFVWQFRKVHRGVSSRFKGIVLYAAYSTVPVLMYIGIFLVLVGVEDLLNISLVDEGYARSLTSISIEANYPNVNFILSLY